MLTRKSLLITDFFIKNCLKNKVFISILSISIIFELASIMMSGLMARDIGRGISDFVFSVVWFSTFIFTLFYSISEISIDKNKDYLQLLFSRPVSKEDYVLGTFLGFSVSIFIITSVIGLLGLLSIFYIQGTVNDFYFSNFSNHIYALALLENVIYCLGLLSFIFLASSLINSSFPLLLVSVSYYMICNGIPVIIDMISSTSGSLIAIDSLHVLQFLFPDYSSLNITSLISNGNSSFSMYDECIKASYFIVYIITTLMLSVFIYKRKELV